MPNDPRLAEAARYPFRTPEIVRFGDTDRMGHVNNASYATYLESGRVALMADLLEEGTGAAFVLARMAIDYRAEIRDLGPIEVGTAVLSVGRSSFVTGQGVFKDGACAATGEGVVVLMDLEARRGVPLPDALRRRLDALMLGA